jgi:hypothetical protein
MTFLAALRIDGITPIVVFSDQPSDSVPVPQDQVCTTQAMLNDAGRYGYIGSNGIYFEAYNEPDNNTSSVTIQQAADLAADTIFGASGSSYSSDAHFLGGVFEGWNIYVEEVYYDEAVSDGIEHDFSAWSFHDYGDPTSSETLNWCYDVTTPGDPHGTAPYDGCTVSEASAFDAWVNGNVCSPSCPHPPYSTWITETAGPVSGFGDTHSVYTDARAATDIEYISHGWASVTLWYDYGPDTGSWDSGLLDDNSGRNCERASWYVIGDHNPTTTAISNAGSCP